MKRRIGLKVILGANGPTKYQWGRRKKYYRGLTTKQNTWIEKRRLQKARHKLKTVFCLDPKDIEFNWCNGCQAAFIFCPDCNNNTCNGTSNCGLCYHYEKLALDTRDDGQRPPTAEGCVERMSEDLPFPSSFSGLANAVEDFLKQPIDG